ncbi:MAG: hypothetical protein ACRD5L_11435 [Bryobacteraceae bacterium]
MKPWILIIVMLSLTGLACADELDDSYQQLKDASGKNDADAVLKWAPASFKLARAEAAKTKPADMSAEEWTKRVEFAKEVDTFSEYALATTASQPSLAPAKTVELVDALLLLNPKSMYLGQCTPAYLAALGKSGAEKQIAGATKIVTGDPDNEDALYALAEGLYAKSPDRAFTYATRLVTVMKSKAKPEGVADADWQNKKNAFLGRGYYFAGIAGCGRQIWKDCDVNLKAAVPYIGKEPGLAGPAYFYLGLANYQLGKITTDRTKIQEALKYSQQAAAIPGPLQQAARGNVTAMSNELKAPVTRH